MRYFVFIIAVLALIGCQRKKEKVFDSFDFAFDGTFSQNLSMKFTQSDTVFVKYYWISTYRRDKKDISLQNVETKVTYYGLLQKEDKQALLDSIAKIDFKKFDSGYIEEHLQDGLHYQLIFQKDSIEKKVTVYGDKAPKQLYSLFNLIGEIKRKTKLTPTNRRIDFKCNLSPPPPPFIQELEDKK